VRVSKVYELVLEAPSLSEAKKLTEEICNRLLANPTKDDYRFEVRKL
ncbi:phosphoribosylformylglycinamidine synthase, purS protein, partial [Candidatus Bathyarchaeota archaeon]